MSTSNNNFSFFSAGIFPRRDFWRNNPHGDFLKHLFKGLKSSLGSLLHSVWHIWVCFKYILTFWFSPWGKIPAGIFPRRNFSPQGFFPMGIFFCTVFILRGYYSMAKYFFLHLFTFILYMVWIQLSCCMLWWSKGVNCILDLLGHKPKDSFSHYAAHIPVFTVTHRTYDLAKTDGYGKNSCLPERVPFGGWVFLSIFLMFI